MNAIESWFRARNPRERMAIGAGAALIALLILYGWIWLPLANDTTRLRGAIAGTRAEAAQVAAGSVEAKRLAAAPHPPAGLETLSAALDQSLASSSLKDRLKVAALDPSRVQLSADAIGFNEWVGLLANLQQTRNARVESARIEPEPGSALVKVQAVLVRRVPG
jgi:general secretion pathway protein M